MELMIFFQSRLFIVILTKSMYSKADCFVYRMWLFAMGTIPATKD